MGVAVLVKNNYKGSQTKRKEGGLNYTNLIVKCQTYPLKIIHKNRHRRISDIENENSSSLTFRVLKIVM